MNGPRSVPCSSNHPRVRGRVNPTSMKAINRDRDDDKEIHDVVVIVTRYTRVKGDLDFDFG